MSRFEMPIVPPEVPGFTFSLNLAERVLKFLLWSRGGVKVYVAGPASICKHLRDTYSRAGARRFDVELMERVYERTFEVRPVAVEDVPEGQCELGLLRGPATGPIPAGGRGPTTARPARFRHSAQPIAPRQARIRRNRLRSIPADSGSPPSVS